MLKCIVDQFDLQLLQLVEESTGEAKLMESMEVEIGAQGWLIIDVTEAAKAWQLDSLANQGGACMAFQRKIGNFGICGTYGSNTGSPC